MKTLLPLLSIFTLITGLASLDAHRWNAGILFPALAVAALFAIAFADGPRPARRTYSMGLARVPHPDAGFGPPRHQPVKLAA